MSTKYFCAHCDEEFTLDQPESKPRCPKCMRKGGVEPVPSASEKPTLSRPALVIPAVALLLAGLAVAIYQSLGVRLEETPPLRPLEPDELAAYLERDEIRVGAYESLFALGTNVEGWPEAPGELSARLRAESSPWSLERALPREVLRADEALGAMAARQDRIELYPLEAAVAMTALLRARGRDAMVAEVWELGTERAPADPSGMLGYFVTAVLDGATGEPSAYYDPWGGRGELEPEATRLLRDTEAIGAALGIEAARVFARSGDGQKALPMAEAAIALDRFSPSHRVVHGTILLESGGVPQAMQELEAANQLRADGPRKINMAQLRLAQAGMMAANGQQADSELSEATTMITEVIEQWPRYGRAHLTMATVHLGLGDLERARVELETAQPLSPDSPMLFAVWAQYHLAKGNLGSASAKMNRAVALDPDNWQLRVQAAGVFAATGDQEAARRNADEALRLVAPARQSQLRSYLDEMLGQSQLQLPDPSAAAPAAPSGDEGPALMLGDPSNLRLRDPQQELQLDLDE